MKLAINGFARSGKDTLAGFISKEENVPTYALADPIKDIMCTLFDWSEEHKNGSLKELELVYSITVENLEKAAELYNQYGLDAYEPFHDCWDKLVKLFRLELVLAGFGVYDCIISPRQTYQRFGTDWGRSVCDTIWLDIAPKDNIIITDIRFNNEAEYFKDLGFKLLQVKREGKRDTGVNPHVSEQGINPDSLDIMVHNNGTVNDMRKMAKQLKTTRYTNSIYYCRVP